MRKDATMPGPDVKKPINAIVSETLPNIRAAYRTAFMNAASLIESGEITTSEQWIKYIETNAGTKQREAMDAVYRAIDELKVPSDFSGKESEIARLNRKIGAAW
jgi:thiamine biosynthesis lipoprotein ApbE